MMDMGVCPLKIDEATGSITWFQIMNLLVGVTGSVAAIKISLVIHELKMLFKAKSGCPFVRIVATEKALQFLLSHPADCLVYDDKYEWDQWSSSDKSIAHIELREWADMMVICPLDANTLAKLANGLCDNLLTCVARAWQFSSKPFLVFPAMNTHMWTHPLTLVHLNVIRAFPIEIVEPVVKTLACGTCGKGGLPQPAFCAREIVRLWERFKPKNDNLDVVDAINACQLPID